MAHQRSKFDRLHREAAGQWLRLPDVNGTILADMCYFTVGSYDATNQVVTTTGTPDNLPSGTPAVPAGVKIYDRENQTFAVDDKGYAIKSLGVLSYDPGTGTESVDWVVLPTAAANPVRSVSIDKDSVGQSAGDVVRPIEVSGSPTRYFSGTVSADPIWVLALDRHDEADLWLPALSNMTGRLTGTYDPNVFDAVNYPDSDERPVYVIDPPQYDMRARVTTKASACDWSDDTTPVPSSDGRATLFFVAPNGADGEGLTDVAFYNYHHNALPVNAIIHLERVEGRLVAQAPHRQPEIVCAFLGSGTPTKGDAVAADTGSVFPGKLLFFNGSTPGSDSSYDQTEDIYIVPSDGASGALTHLDRLNGFWIGRFTGSAGERDLYFAERPRVNSDLLLAKITAQVSARSSDTYGTLANVDLGHLVSGVWTETVSDVTVYNPSLSTVNVDGGTIHIPVASINNHWILLNATDLLQVDGWVTANDQSIGHDASGTDVLWQDDSECPA